MSEISCIVLTMLGGSCHACCRGMREIVLSSTATQRTPPTSVGSTRRGSLWILRLRSKRLLNTGLILVLAGIWFSVGAAPDLEKMLLLAQQRYGATGTQNVQQWRGLLRETQGLAEAEKIKRVNDFFNRRITFRDDIEIWGATDYWATPLETLGRATGDCEDFTIAKYVTLKLLDLPIDRMRLIYVRAQIGGPRGSISQAHMVLGYYATPGAEPLILDNLISDIRPASQRSDLLPVFSFNSDGLWVGQSADSSASPTARLSRWRDVITRMQAEGLEWPTK